ncbi:MAG: patatin-like phospholipase family protein [Candidatus Competibacteraceae bacterium]|nr:patatin-like phospholipase family protein [Candidatus Competibacteraceae bacterium]
MKRSSVSFKLVTLAMATVAALLSVSASGNERPKVGLVLSGGGARGAAHIGVIRVLEDLRVPIDCIAGTSMGAIIGGLYAAGFSVEEMEHTLTSIDWGDIFNDSPPRKQRSFRRKRDDDTFLVKAKPGLKDGELALPKGAIQGQKLNLLLSRLAQRAAHIQDFDRLKVPYRAVATDIGTGEAVVLASGNLSDAMRASMSIPSALAPIEIDGKLLVDGGVSNNLPMDVARDTCADVLVVVDIGTPLTPTEELTSVLSITDQLTTIMTQQNTTRQLQTLQPNDVLIRPTLGDITTMSFERANEAIPLGVEATSAERENLERLALSTDAYPVYLAGLTVPDMTTEPVIDFIRIENDSGLADEVIAARLRIQPGDRLRVAELEKDLGTVHGLDNFQRVDYSLVREQGKTGLVVHAVAKDWGPNYLQFGLNLESDTDGDGTFNLGLGYIRTEVNQLGGEWRILGSFGNNFLLFSDFYQPLDEKNRWFLVPEVSYERFDFGVFESGKQVAEYRVNRTRLTLAGGLNLADGSELRLGIERAWGEADLLIGDPSLRSGDFNDGGISLRWWKDTLDNVNFPTQGQETRIDYVLSLTELGADNDFQALSFEGVWPLSWGKDTIIPRVVLQGRLDGTLGPQNRFLLGGFLNLSGFQSRELSGEYLGLGQLVYLHRLDDASAAFTLPIYLGGSLEIGNVWEDVDDLKLDTLLTAGSLFLGLDTPLGPLYLGGGYAEGGNGSLYLFLGQTF